MKRLFSCLILLLTAGLATAQEPFARLEAQPAVIYAGQTFTLTLSIYLPGYDLDSGSQLGGLPDSLQYQPFQELGSRSETVNGHTYQVIGSRWDAVSPAPGVLHFEPVIHGNSIRTVQNLFLTQRYRSPVQIRSPPFDLTIRPIPLDQAPPGYDGLIGAFTLDASASTNRLLPGDLVTLAFTVSGTGRFDRLPPLGYKSAPGFRAYPARETKPKTGTMAKGVTQIVIPETAESLTLPPFTIVAFNPQREAFDTLTAGPFRFEADTNRPAGQPPPPVVIEPDEPVTAEVRLRPIYHTLIHPPEDAAIRTQAETLFRQGVNAQSASNETAAIEAYAKLLTLGVRTPEVYANLGAAFARSGSRGKAVLYLLRAIRAAPRETVARNWLQEASDSRARPRLPALSRLGLAEWRRLTLLLSGLAVILILVSKRWRGTALPAVLCLAAALGSAGACLWWLKGPPAVERVVTAPQAQGRLAPDAAAAPTIRFDDGAVVGYLETSGDWCRVEAGGVTAWLPSSTLEKP